MEQLTLRGVVLSAMPISEYDKRLVILTKERGKITAFARGARKQNSPFLAGSQPLTFGEYTVYQGRNSYTVTGVKVTRYFAQDMTDIDKMSYGMYFLELSDYFGHEGVEAGDNINLIYLANKALLSDAINYRLIRTIFELRMLVINGEYPDFFSCTNCGRENDLYAFDIYVQGMVCINCCGNEKRFIKLNDSAIYALQYIITAPVSRLFSFNVTDEIMETMASVVEVCIKKVTDRQFKSLEFISRDSV